MSAGEDVAVEVDGVWWSLLRVREGGEEESRGESEGFHEWSVSRSLPYWGCFVFRISDRGPSPSPLRVSCREVFSIHELAAGARL